jgi:hypothetical protein
MTTRLKEILQEIAPKPLSDMELEAATRNLIGFAKCLLAMKQEILNNESSHTNSCINQDAGRGVEFNRTEQQAF